MKRSIFLFLGGAVFGVSIAVFLQSTGTSDENSQPLHDVQFNGLADAVAALNTTAESLRASADRLASVTLPASGASTSLSQEPSSAQRPSVSADQMLLLPSISPMPAANAGNVVQQAQEPAPPTPEQVEQYHTLQSSLRSAAYDSSAVMTELTQQANKLTPTQRQELANEAMEMIKRGELKAEQFMPRPGS